MKYMIWGRTAEAKIISVRKTTVSSRRRLLRSPKEVFAVRYHWTDRDDGPREDVMNLGLDWQHPEDDLLQIDYLPGVKESRMHGHRNYIALSFFIAMSGILIFFTVRTWREAYRK